MRTKSVTPEIIEMMRDSGCVAVSYGMETGSAQMLEVMEKKTSIDDNYKAQTWNAEAGFETLVQLVLAMPGLTRLILKGRFGEAMIAYPVFFYRLRRFLALMVLFKNLIRFSLSYNLKLVGEYLVYQLIPARFRKSYDFGNRSLRKVVDSMESIPNDAVEMACLA